MTRPVSELLDLYNAQAPIEEAFTIPAPWYLDERIAALEQQQVFGRNWIAAGHAGQVAKPGGFFTTMLAGEPLMIVRGADNILRAFFNVCRHHAAAVITAPCGTAQHLRCPYHGWTYGLDGSLKGTPEFNGVCSFDRAQNGLVPIRVAQWEQFVFVNLCPDAPSLERHLSDLPSRVAPLDLTHLHFFERRTYTLACNWKVYVDNYLDGGYHVPHLHKGLNSILDYKQYTIENEDRYCLQSSPMVASDEDAATGATRKGDRARYFWQYPNLMINCYEGYMDTNYVIPIDQDHCTVVFDFYFSDVSDARRGRGSSARCSTTGPTISMSRKSPPSTCSLATVT